MIFLLAIFFLFTKNVICQCPNGGQISISCDTNVDGVQADDCIEIKQTCSGLALTGSIKICDFSYFASGNLNAFNLVSPSGFAKVTLSPQICVTLCGNLNDPTNSGQCDQPVGPICLPVGVPETGVDLCPSSEGRLTCSVNAGCAKITDKCPDWIIEGTLSICDFQLDAQGTLTGIGINLGSATLHLDLSPSLCVALTNNLLGVTIGPICVP